MCFYFIYVFTQDKIIPESNKEDTAQQDDRASAAFALVLLVTGVTPTLPDRPSDPSTQYHLFDSERDDNIKQSDDKGSHQQEARDTAIDNPAGMFGDEEEATDEGVNKDREVARKCENKYHTKF